MISATDSVFAANDLAHMIFSFIPEVPSLRGLTRSCKILYFVFNPILQRAKTTRTLLKKEYEKAANAEPFHFNLLYGCSQRLNIFDNNIILTYHKVYEQQYSEILDTRLTLEEDYPSRNSRSFFCD